MSTGRRIGKCLTGIMMVILAIFMITMPDTGYLIITLIFGISLLVSAIGALIYYFSLARHMVGGRSTLVSALIQLDLAIFTLTLTDIPRIFLMIYLISVFGIAGILSVSRGLEARSRKAPSWYLSFISGIINLLITLLCMIFIQNDVVMVIIYSIGMIIAGLRRIISAFYRSTIVYVQ